MQASMNDKTGSGNLLSNRGGRVLLRQSVRHRRFNEHYLQVATGDHRCFATLKKLLPEHEFSDLSDFTGGSAAPRAFELDDASRRASPTMRDIAGFESAVESVGAVFASLPVGTNVVLHSADNIDIPSLRIIATAWLRGYGNRDSCLVLETGGSLPDAAADAARRFAFDGVIRGLQASASEITQYSGARREDNKFSGDAVTSLLRRNFVHVLQIAGDDPDGLLLRSLAAAGSGNIAAALSSLDSMEQTSPSPVDRARACSTRAVILAKYGGTNRLQEAEASVASGHYYTNKISDDSIAAAQRGWLYNNAGLIQIVRWMGSHEPALLNTASQCLRDALNEVIVASPAAAPALHYNVQANAVQLLELMGQHSDALNWLNKAFSQTEHASYFYRRAVLLMKLGNLDSAESAINLAEECCNRRDWHFHETIDRARGYINFAIGRMAIAESHFRQGLDTCRRVRMANGTISHAKGLIACLNAMHRKTNRDELIGQLEHEESLAIDGSVAVVPMPPSKLPTYVPELDLLPSHRPTLNAVLDGSKMEHKP